MLDAIVAAYADWGIGAKGTQPVVIKADRRRFRELTEGGAVIVGRKTLSDFPGGRPLKNRANIVLTRQSITIEGAETAGSVEQALKLAAPHPRVFVIGGESVYRELLPHIGRIYVTKIAVAPHSDVFFRDLDADPAWRVTEEDEEAEENGIRCRFLTYERV